MGTHEREPANPAAAALGSLTAAELRVAIAVGSGRSNREAADELFISVKTVDHHLQHIYRKLGIKSRSSLAVLVTKWVEAGGPTSDRDAVLGDEQLDVLTAFAEQPSLPRLRDIGDPMASFEAT